MQGFFIFVFSMALGGPEANASSDAFKDSFRAYLEMRRFEEKSTLLEATVNLEPEEKNRERREISSRLTQARIDFHSILSSEGSALSTWEKSVLQRVSGKKRFEGKIADEETLLFLGKNYPLARNFSAFEWQAVSEFFGQSTQEAFLKSIYALEPVPTHSAAVIDPPTAIWIITPSFPILTLAELSKLKKERAQATKKLKSAGYKMEEIAVSSFIRLEDQSEDLQNSIRHRLSKGNFFLLTQGSTSAVLLRTFDLFPDLLQKKEILGWLNLNGQLFGPSRQSNGRKPASLAKITAADKQLFDVNEELLRLRLERLDPQAPLGAKFPVLNLVTLKGSHRPTMNLRESVVPEGKTFFLLEGSGFSSIESALPAMISP